jgi:hypothetical protein
MPKCSIRRSSYDSAPAGRWIAEAFEAVCTASDTNDTKSMARDIVAIPKGRMVAKLP